MKTWRATAWACCWEGFLKRLPNNALPVNYVLTSCVFDLLHRPEHLCVANSFDWPRNITLYRAIPSKYIPWTNLESSEAVLVLPWPQDAVYLTNWWMNPSVSIVPPASLSLTRTRDFSTSSTLALFPLRICSSFTWTTDPLICRQKQWEV